MNQTSDPTIEDDDALGLALRAFVDDSLRKGVERSSITYALMVASVRIAFDLQREQTAVLRLIHNAVNDVANLARAAPAP